jgi:hypothetical protein
MLENLKSFFKSNLKSLISIISIIIILLCILATIVNNSSYKSDIAKQVDYYYFTWSDFKNISGTTLHEKWNQKFHDATYKLNGDAKYNQYDCVSSIYWLLRDLKSNFTLLDVNSLLDELNRKSFRRKNYSEIQIKDLVIICIGNSWHVGIIEEKKGNGLISYIDVNVGNNGAGYKQVPYNSNIIVGIYPITFTIWIGDLLKNIK